MEELFRALTPWPMAQGIFIGLAIAGAGVWAIHKGLQDKKAREPGIEDMKADWAAREQLRHIHDNSFANVRLQEKSNELLVQVLAAVNRFNDDRWNK